MQYISDLAVYTYGSPEKKPIVFVHGFPLSAAMWKYQVTALQEDFYCVTYDIRGLGNSSAGHGQFTLESMVDDLELVIQSLHIHKPVICGLSMGGYICLRAAERNPELFGGFIFCDTKSAADNDETKIKRANAVKRINRGEAVQYINEFIPTTIYAENKARIYAENENELNQWLMNDPVGVKGCLIAMAARTDTTQALKNIPVPALFICGEEDSLSTPEVMKTMADNSPGSRFALIKKAGHLSPLEMPNEVNMEIKNYLDTI